MSTELAEGVSSRASAPGTELDLDGARPAARAGRPFAAALAAAVLLSALAGAGLRGVLLGPPVNASDAVIARLVLRDVQLRPEPVAVLQLTITGAAGSRLTGLSIGGGGLQATLSDSRAIDSPGDTLQAEVTAQLRCSLRTAQTPVAAAVQVDDAGFAVGVGEVVTAGRLGQAGGVCRTADERLPDGWQNPVDVASAEMRGQALELRVRKLAGTDQVFGAVSGAELFGVRQGGRDADGTLTLLLQPTPARICGQVPAMGLPAGVGLQVIGPGRSSRTRYAAAGVVAARWVARQRQRPCVGTGGSGGSGGSGQGTP